MRRAVAKNPGRIRLLLSLLPTAMSLAGGASQAIALESSGSSVVSSLGSALRAGDLHNAQSIVDAAASCSVNSIVVGDTTLTIEQLNVLITDLAKGDKAGWQSVAPVFESIGQGAGALFVADSINTEQCVADGIDPKSDLPPSSQT